MYFANLHSHLRYGILFWGGDGTSKKIFKLQKKLMRLISNVGRDTAYRVLFKTVNIFPLPCVYIMEIVYYIKMNIGKLEQNSGIIKIHIIDQLFNPSSEGIIFFKKIVYIIWR
jgi:hypothetical protein